MDPPMTDCRQIPASDDVTVVLTEEQRHHVLSAMLSGTVTTACPTCSAVIEKLRVVTPNPTPARRTDD